MFYLIHKISHYFLAHYHACMLSLKNLIRAPLSSLLTILAIALSLTLPIVSLISLINIQSLTHQWNTGSTITLYLEKNTTPSEAQTLLSTLLGTEEIESGNYLPPESVLKSFKSWSHLEDAITLLPENPLPGVITLHPKAAYESPQALEQLTHNLKELTHVDHLAFDQEGFSKLNAILQLAEALFFTLLGLVGLGISVVIANTVRLALERHKEEIDILSLIGATPSFIRRPFLYRALWYGILGTLLSYSVVVFSIRPLEPFLQKVASLYGESFHLQVGDTQMVLIIMALGILLGWIGALMAFMLYEKKTI